MTLFWILAIAMLMLVGWLVLPSLFARANRDDVDRAEMNRALQRDELAALDAARARGELDEAEYQQAQSEVQRRILESERESPQPSARRPLGRATAVTLVLLVPTLAVLGYRTLGSGASAVEPETPIAQTASPHAGMNMSNADAGPIDQLTERLAQRLRDNPDDVDGWLLLARSYKHLGQNDAALAAFREAQQRGGEDAELAGSLAVPVTNTVAALSSATADLAALKARTDAAPNDGDAWLALAQGYRSERNFAAASAAYENAKALLPANADLLADYADALAASRDRRLDGEPNALVNEALQLDPDHPKALWLAATAALRSGDRATAKTHWQRLQRVLPEDSPDRRIIDRNLASMDDSAIDPQTNADAWAPVASIRGRVDISPELRARVADDDTVFVFARAVNGPPMPLAVLRKRVRDLPFEFTLDDSLAMQPQLKLSGFDEVMLGVRVSRSGTVNRNAGEPRGDLGPVQTRGGGDQRLLIDRTGS